VRAPAGALRHFWQALKRWKNAQLCEFFVLSANAARSVMHTARGSAIMFEPFERMSRPFNFQPFMRAGCAGQTPYGSQI
jgi:hypothetical protein